MPISRDTAGPPKGLFRSLAQKTAEATGSAAAFWAAVALVGAWFSSGFFFGFSNAWQLLINTVTNVVTLLIVFLIQNSQNRDAKAMHLKLDELIRAVREARTSLVSLENLSDEELALLQEQFRRIQRQEMRRSREGDDTAPVEPAS